MERPSSPTDRGRGKRPWVVVAIVALVAIAILGLWFSGYLKSADERLAEMEAARAIPEAQNAAIIYDKLLRDPRAASLWDSPPNVMMDPNFRGVFDKPWRAEDYPEVAAWIIERQYLIDALSETSKLKKCRFQIRIDLTAPSVSYGSIRMFAWASLLRLAANNDLAEGRFDQAIVKWQSALQMASHLRQQPLLADHVQASNIAKSVFESMAPFVVAGDSTEAHLQLIEAISLPPAEPWKRYIERIRAVDNLAERKKKESFGLWGRIRYPLHSYRARRAMRQMYGFSWKDQAIEQTGNMHRQSVTMARGLRILVALRRHKNATGHWPAGLDQIEPPLPPVTLTDPLNGGPFIYTASKGTFTLQSQGPSETDEGDDLSIWPPHWK